MQCKHICHHTKFSWTALLWNSPWKQEVVPLTGLQTTKSPTIAYYLYSKFNIYFSSSPGELFILHLDMISLPQSIPPNTNSLMAFSTLMAVHAKSKNLLHRQIIRQWTVLLICLLQYKTSPPCRRRNQLRKAQLWSKCMLIYKLLCLNWSSHSSLTFPPKSMNMVSATNIRYCTSDNYTQLHACKICASKTSGSVVLA